MVDIIRSWNMIIMRESRIAREETSVYIPVLLFFYDERST